MKQKKVQIADGVFMVTSQEGLCSNVYVLIGRNGKTLLIDSGSGVLEFDFDPHICLLTHGHLDHTLGVKSSWNEVYLHPQEFSFKGPYIKIPDNAKAFSKFNVLFPPFFLEIIHTPGHTPGSVCIFERKKGILFSGDTKFAKGGRGRTDLGGDENKIINSLNLIESLPYKLLCPGHGDIERRKQRTL
ncbi:MAG: MBL fold metallo-hydrolase [Candidatus Anstonellales archaeon]